VVCTCGRRIGSGKSVRPSDVADPLSMRRNTVSAASCRPACSSQRGDSG
jgi:hypothetical protein